MSLFGTNFAVRIGKGKQVTNQYFTIMARPIKETPVLTGRDAERFVQNMYTPAPVSQQYKEQMQETFQTFKQAATFAL